MTERERFWWLFGVIFAGGLMTVGAGYTLGRTVERQSRDAVACTPFADSVRVVPRYRPSGPVPGGTP